MRKFIDIVETPIIDVQHHGDWSDTETNHPADTAIENTPQNNQNSFLSKTDRHLAQSPEIINRLIKLMAKSKPEVCLYMLNDRGAGNHFQQNIDYGWMDEMSVAFQERLPEEVREAVLVNMDLYPKTIHVLLTHNEGGRIRHPLTPWMICHRMCHALLGQNARLRWPDEIQNQTTKTFKALKSGLDLDTFLGRNMIVGGGSVIVGSIMRQCFTFASAREDRILRIDGADPYFELWVEAFVQYVTTGKIEVKMPEGSVKIGEKKIAVTDPEAFRAAAEQMVDGLEGLFDSILWESRDCLMVC